MGTARDMVTGSTSCPAWRARVSNPCCVGATSVSRRASISLSLTAIAPSSHQRHFPALCSDDPASRPSAHGVAVEHNRQCSLRNGSPAAGAHERTDDLGQRLPLLEKGVVPVRRIELVILDVFAKSTQAITQGPYRRGGEQPVRADSDEQHWGVDTAEPCDLATVPANLVEVHRAR